MLEPTYDFYGKIARIINSGQSRSIIVAGNIQDLYWDGENYVPLIPFLLKKTATKDTIQLVYELNGPIRTSDENKAKLCESYVEWKGRIANYDWKKDLSNKGPSLLTTFREEFARYWKESIADPSRALEFMRQLFLASRDNLKQPIRLFIEGADMIVPMGNGDVASLHDHQLRRINIMQDWFSEPAFVNGRDMVCLFAESTSQIHERVSKLPQLLTVEVPAPKTPHRRHYIEDFQKKRPEGCSPIIETEADLERVSIMTGGLSIYALRQLLVEAMYLGKSVSDESIIQKVEQYIKSQLGEDVVEFKRPTHTLDDVIGARKVVAFIKKELLPRMEARDDSALAGCVFSGPIGGGKTFIGEAIASMLRQVVLILKNLRSQWYGGTDVIFERLKRVIEAIDKVNIFVDEADTQFGGVGADVHETERRLTGKIQAMMSDPALRGRVFWTLMTARVHRLSPDVKRPKRAGDLILPILDPEGEDRMDFIRWTLNGINVPATDEKPLEQVLNDYLSPTYSAASYAALRSHLSPYRKIGVTRAQVIELVEDLIPADIEADRLYQKMQALLNCTRKSLLPESEIKDGLNEARNRWRSIVRTLEAQGIK